MLRKQLCKDNDLKKLSKQAALAIIEQAPVPTLNSMCLGDGQVDHTGVDEHSSTESQSARPGTELRELSVDVSVIISAFNRGDGLRATLESLLTQETGGVAYEVIAVDNNSTDNTAEVIRSFMAKAHVKLSYLFEPRQGVSHGRNAGIGVARAPVIAFTDDDVVVAPDWIRAIKRHFDENPDIDYLSGKMLPIFHATPPRWLTATNSGPCRSCVRSRRASALLRARRFLPGLGDREHRVPPRGVRPRRPVLGGLSARARIWSGSYAPYGAPTGAACTRRA